MPFQFQKESKFGLLAIKNVYVDVPASEFQLSDGTWVLPGIPVSDLGVWAEWLGSIAIGELKKANLVLLRDEASSNPEILDEVHHRLDDELSRLFYLLQLSGVLEYQGAQLLLGSSLKGQPQIREVGEMRQFVSTRGCSRNPITVDRLEEASRLRDGLERMESAPGGFKRIVRGLNALFDGLMREHGQDRIHQFVRSLEAVILPDISKTKKQFIHRCQTFAKAGSATRQTLIEAFDMRSDTEHLHDWERALHARAEADRENVALQRVRQMQLLATSTYSRILGEVSVQPHFETEVVQADFWNRDDAARRAIWGTPVDLEAVPLVTRYDQWNRALIDN